MNTDLFDNRPKVKKKLNILPDNPDPQSKGRFPSWLHRKLPKGFEIKKTGKILGEKRLNTVCEEAKCPNLLECWSRKTATFLILGKECTRSCGFCDIDFSKKPIPPEQDEPLRVAQSVLDLGLEHVVITMVARDDLNDGGAAHLVKVVEEIRRQCYNVTIEVLTSDFEGKHDSWELILGVKPEIFNYNVETVRELTPKVRHKATYDRTLELLNYVQKNKLDPNMRVKSGMMVGLGETEEQVFKTIDDLKKTGVDIITIGQYLQANRKKLRVRSFVTPEQFKKYEEYGHSIGIKQMYCGPFVRSSYNAKELINNGKFSCHR